MSILENYFGSDYKKSTVWAKGHEIPGYDKNVWRRDDHGWAMKYSDYGDRNSEYGWEFDHYPVPAILGGADDISNLRPLHWEGNATHGGLLGAFLNNPMTGRT